jgi:hypothetical protein
LVRISWPAARAAGLELQFTSSLASPNWFAAPETVTTLDGISSVNVSVTGAGRFYRLGTPP